jgi:hypothetical protein
MLILGIDPDSNKHGVAVYRNGVLCELLNLNTIQLYKHIIEKEKVALKNKQIVIHMENPKGTSASCFSHNRSDSYPVKFKKSEGVGMCKQAQTSVEQMAEELGIQVILHKNSKCWKKGNDKVMFEKITGWIGRSNEETRSAAFMGYLGVKQKNPRG